MDHAIANVDLVQEWLIGFERPLTTADIAQRVMAKHFYGPGR